MARKKHNNVLEYNPRVYADKKKSNFDSLFADEEKTANGKLFEEAPIFYSENTIILDRCFESQLRQADDSLKVVYSELKNELLSYKNVKAKMLRKVEVFRCSGVVAKLRIKGKSLYLYLKLDPASIDTDFLKVADKSHRNGFEEVPCEIKVTGKLKTKRSIYLIQLMMEAFEIEKRKSFEPTDYSAIYTFVENAVIKGSNMILR